MEQGHASVLTKESLSALAVKPGDIVVDATLGGAGHFAELLSCLGSDGMIIGIDADLAAVERGRKAYAEDRRPERPVAHLINENFRNVERVLERLKVSSVNAVLFDLGWSGYQITEPRGFTFQKDEPLLMNYSDAGETAADLINSATEKELADLIYTYGEEHFARGIARSIVHARAEARILTTGALVTAVLNGTPVWYHKRKIHPATKTFQALRMAVNDELGSLREGLTGALNTLAPEGRLAVITFHSIEDRIVKSMLRDAVHAGLGELTPKKPIVPSRREVLANRRARSAKLRVFTRAAAPATDLINSLTPFIAYV